MALRVHWRSAFGRKSSAALRSLYLVVLGLGGWFLGALLVLTTLPGIPLLDELLTTLSSGLPIGLGVYLAWVNRDWSARTKTTGFPVAVGGALLGAWLGFNVTSAAFGFLAPLCAIVGAAVGANLTALALDIAWDRQLRDRFAAATARETLEARPSTG
jgi:hypothetical protein